jgi:hypothetical protein
MHSAPSKKPWLKSTVISLPIDLAFIAAAEQNFHRDVRMRLVGEHHWDQEKETYLLDACSILKEHGANHEPMYVDHQHIEVAGDLDAELNTKRSREYLASIDMWHDQRSYTDRYGQAFELLKPAPRAYLNIKGK